MDKQEHLEIDVPFVGPQPTTPRPTVAHRVSLSPNVSPKKSLSPQQMRKSTRSKTSTVIYVDGYAIKKDNNYVLKGGQYVFALVDNSEAKPQRTNSFTTAKKAVADAKAPRKVTAAEQERLEKKADLEKAIQQKAVARQTFLKTHINVFKPFLEPKVLGRIQTYNVPSSLSETFSVYMQPDAIKADLRDYQLEALQWMSKMYQRNVGMILGDEMGKKLLPLLYRATLHVCLPSFLSFSSHFCNTRRPRKDAADHFAHLPHQGSLSGHWTESRSFSFVGA